MQQLNLLYTVNSSLLLWNEHTKLLVDGLHDPALLFSPMTATASKGLSQNIPPFDNIDYLVFTHGHPDHFSLPRTQEYLANHTVSALILPPESGGPENASVVIRSMLPPLTGFIEPCMGPWEERTYTLGNFKATYIGTPHIRAPLPPKYNYSVILSVEGMNIFIGGDLNFPKGAQLDYLISKKIDYGFFNPFFLLHRDGQKALSALHLKMVYIYHIPYERPDNRDFLVMIDESMRSNGKRLAPITLLFPDAPQFSLPI